MKYVISIFIFFMITGWTSNVGNKYTEAAGNYKIGEIKYWYNCIKLINIFFIIIIFMVY